MIYTVSMGDSSDSLVFTVSRKKQAYHINFTYDSFFGELGENFMCPGKVEAVEVKSGDICLYLSQSDKDGYETKLLQVDDKLKKDPLFISKLKAFLIAFRYEKNNYNTYPQIKEEVIKTSLEQKIMKEKARKRNCDIELEDAIAYSRILYEQKEEYLDYFKKVYLKHNKLPFLLASGVCIAVPTVCCVMGDFSTQSLQIMGITIASWFITSFAYDAFFEKKYLNYRENLGRKFGFTYNEESKKVEFDDQEEFDGLNDYYATSLNELLEYCYNATCSDLSLVKIKIMEEYKKHLNDVKNRKVVDRFTNASTLLLLREEVLCNTSSKDLKELGELNSFEDDVKSLLKYVKVSTKHLRKNGALRKYASYVKIIKDLNYDKKEIDINRIKMGILSYVDNRYLIKKHQEEQESLTDIFDGNVSSLCYAGR